ncbi:MAG: F0F1 ATP synthase subunit beta, partial [Clostridia bacterium]|nr:F0F1 ATP synthase subunit beta [Clostridia bacterium]
MNETKHIGVVTQVIGPVIDVRFDDGRMPDILNAIEVEWGGRRLVAEVSAHVGDDVAR